jgi:hypothetical protein
VAHPQCWMSRLILSDSYAILRRRCDALMIHDGTSVADHGVSREPERGARIMHVVLRLDACLRAGRRYF